MIGQEKLLLKIDKVIDNESFPRFSIIQGNGQCGKKTLTRYIASRLSAQVILVDIRVETIREAIKLAYQQSEPSVYLIADADRMSPGAKNALLKITEEPPRKAFFIMTLQDSTNTLETLRSRGTIWSMLPYSKKELEEYLECKDTLFTEDPEKEIILKYSENPGDVDLFLFYRYEIMDLYNYAKKVVFNIGRVNGANAFKIGSKLSFKDDDGGWDCRLFLRIVMYLLVECMSIEFNSDHLVPEELAEFIDQGLTARLAESSIRTSSALSELVINGINKAATIDMWILDLRTIWK